jgi:raffinose/stachyose/melibiose transport system substrate-binding protein
VNALRRLIVLALISMIALCVFASTAAARPQETVTLRFSSWAETKVGWDVIIQNFERVYPNIHVDPSYVPAATFPQVLLTQLSGGTAPDLFFSSPGNADPSSIWPLAQAGKLLPLSHQPWEKRIYAPTKHDVVYNGKVYGWPVVVGAQGVLYNVDLFKQLGLSVPQTFSDVLQMCRKAVAAGKVPFAQAFGDPTAGIVWGLQRMNEEVYSIDPNWTQKRNKKTVAFATSPLWRQALQSIVDMKNAGCFQAGVQAATYPQQYALFANGSAVMTVIANLQLGGIQAANPSINVGMFNLPPADKTNAVVSTFSAATIAVNAQTQYPKEARTFLAFLARPKQSSTYAAATGGIAPFDAAKGIVPAYMKPMAALFKAGKAVLSPPNDWPKANIFYPGLAFQIAGFFTGQKSVDDILKGLDTLWDQP